MEHDSRIGESEGESNRNLTEGSNGPALVDMHNHLDEEDDDVDEEGEEDGETTITESEDSDCRLDLEEVGGKLNKTEIHFIKL